MTKEEFLQLQSDHHQSGLSLKSYLKQIGTGYSTYNYWRKKYCCVEDQCHDLAPISFRHSSPSSGSVFTGDVPSGATLLFPNGRRAGSGDGGSVGIELAVLSHQVAQRCHLHRALVIVASRSGSADRGLGDVGLAASSSAEPVQVVLSAVEGSTLNEIVAVPLPSTLIEVSKSALPVCVC